MHPQHQFWVGIFIGFTRSLCIGLNLVASRPFWPEVMLWLVAPLDERSALRFAALWETEGLLLAATLASYHYTEIQPPSRAKSVRLGGT